MMRIAYHSQSASDTTVPIRPLTINTNNWFSFGNSNSSILVKCNMKNTGHMRIRFQRPTKPVFFWEKENICLMKFRFCFDSFLEGGSI